MSKFYHEPIHTQPSVIKGKNPSLQGFETPFKIFAYSSDSPFSIKISNLSNLLNSPSLDDKVVIAGLNCPITIQYGNKIWLEVFYDKNLSPVAAIIKTGNKWPAKTRNVSNNQELLEVYPNEFEFISKYDLADKAAEIQATISSVTAFKTNVIEELDLSKYFGIITQDEYSSYLEEINTNYDNARNNLTDLQNNLNNFFSASPIATWKKLFRTYLLLGYTTKNMSEGADGINFIVQDTRTQSDPSIPQASKPSSFRLVSCWNSDILLADFCYQNKYPAKTPIAMHRAVNFYSINGQNEEDKNTA